MEGCILRPFRESDLGPLTDMVDREWSFHLYGDRWQEVAEGYIRMHISRSDLVLVAEREGRTLGIVCAVSSPSEEPLPDEGPRGPFDIDRRVLEEADAELRSMSDLSGLGELALLILSEDARGTGLGALMLEEVRRFLSGKGCRGMYISTDSDCSYGFYDHMGAVRIGECVCTVMGEELTRMLYRLDFE